MAKRLPDILIADEEQSLLPTLNRRYPTATWFRLMVWLVAKTGMRVGDLMNLQWEDLGPDTGRTATNAIRVRRTRLRRAVV